MQQVKIFKSHEDATDHLEEQINTWIKSSGAKVLSIVGNIAPQSTNSSPESKATLSRGNFAPSDVMVFVLYEAG